MSASRLSMPVRTVFMSTFTVPLAAWGFAGSTASSPCRPVSAVWPTTVSSGASLLNVVYEYRGSSLKLMVWATVTAGHAVTAIIPNPASTSVRMLAVLPDVLLLGRDSEGLVARAAGLPAKVLDDGLGLLGVAGRRRVLELDRPGLEVLGRRVELALLLPDLGLGRRLRRIERAVREQRGNLLGGLGQLLRVRHHTLDVTGLGLVLHVLPGGALLLHQSLALLDRVGRAHRRLSRRARHQHRDRKSVV